MRSLRIGTAALALAALTLAATPALAEQGERRNPNRGDRGGQTAQPRGERRGPDVRQDSRPSNRGSDAPRYNSRGSDRRGPGSDRGVQAPRYDRRDRDNRAYDGRRNDGPRNDGRRYDGPRNDGRRYDGPRNGNRGYDSRRYDGGRYAVPRVGPPPPRYDRRYDRRYDYRPRSYGYYGRSYGYRPYTRLHYGRPYGYRPYGYRHGWSFNLYFGRPYGSYGYANPYYGYYSISPGFAYGSLRIVDAPRDAQVFVDGYYAGVVDEYDGVFQRLNLEPGPHRIEIVVPGYENEVFDVDILPGQTITYRSNYY